MRNLEQKFAAVRRPDMKILVPLAAKRMRGVPDAEVLGNEFFGLTNRNGRDLVCKSAIHRVSRLAFSIL
jgi:hypothetical protein